MASSDQFIIIYEEMEINDKANIRKVNKRFTYMSFFRIQVYPNYHVFKK